ncbi:hypothetical protein HMPREF3033_00058 [Veillonellaceae bacterium DNF00751]|nr:hypothetical protein HMPREF3033_00058 [Veillonellaceae bacterium DNF00751]
MFFLLIEKRKKVFLFFFYVYREKGREYLFLQLACISEKISIYRENIIEMRENFCK